MSPADEYRKKVVELEARARGEKSPAARIEWLKMARGYRKLAELADRNAKTDIVYEPRIPVAVQRQQHQALEQPQQQQQQPQAEGQITPKTNREGG